MECPICKAEMDKNAAYKDAYRCKSCNKNWLIREIDIPIHLATESFMRILTCDRCDAWDKFEYYYTCERDHRDYTCVKCKCGHVNVERCNVYGIDAGNGKVAIITYR